MKKCLRVFLAIAIVCVLSFGLSRQARASVRTGDLAPDFKLQDLAQDTVSLSDYIGKKPVFLFFWTTWCPYCRTGLKNLNGLHLELTQKGWGVLAIDMGEPLEKVERFAERYPLKLKVLLDRDIVVSQGYGILGVPTYVLIDKNGIITFKENYFPSEKMLELAP